MSSDTPDRSYRAPFFGTLFGTIVLLGRWVGYHISCGLLNHRQPMLAFLTLLSWFRPVAIVWNTVFVAKAGDVRDVLSRLEDFTIADVLGPQMPWGPFLLGIDWPEQHAKERQFLEKVVCKPTQLATERPFYESVLCRDDADKIRNQAAIKSSECIKQAQADGKIDVVANLCEPVVVETVANYFGIRSKDSQRMARVLGQVAGFVMVNPPAGLHARREALESISELTVAIVQRIEDEDLAPQASPAPDILARLVAELKSGKYPAFFSKDWEDRKDWIRRYVTGLAVFGGGTVTRATTHAIDQLIRYPHYLEKACKLAADIDDGADIGKNRRQLLRIIYEALRFRPMLPLLKRYIPRETVIGKVSGHARPVPAGATVIAAPIAAMFDPDEFEHPRCFKDTRPLENFIHFGFGPRLCFGQYIAEVLIVEMVIALLRCGKLNRAPGSKGYIRYDGPVPKSLWLTFS